MSATPFAEIGELSTRIAALTSITRTLEQDARRVEVNGGTRDDLYQRVAATAVATLRKTAHELEKTLA